ncbi:Protein of unknown function (DUF3186) [Rubrobacter radiotolerans]|uniref:Copper transporter n=1 Tax=Rubrobacter radiotolerans TaxID=42256 RepID=A0A023X406_RUBRA|nr:copper transporter [Rubrobacter radiotolerans]AHY46740.1 Protein of unknown function (DUF3186) [Rubrobacter radiotolerans]MDX5894147.1 copper transporter [Rubrobacter radiotolerans]SMC05302.1 Copper transport outer membrane protein, MctB [Rubrobacter radiotolerans DSM 5868]
MPDLRYHLISLISVFLALAIGILLGVAVADQGVVSSGLEAQITDIEERFSEQQAAIAERDEQIARLQERTAGDEALMLGMSESLISDRLLGLEVAVVSGPYTDPATTDSALDALAGAGANVTSVEELPPPQDSEVTSAEGEATTPVELDYLSLAEVIASESGDADTPPQAVVFVGGGGVPPEAPPGTLEALNGAKAGVFDLWLDAGLRVVAVESSAAERSEIELFQSASLPSVDNVDTAAGRAALVELLASEDDGSYGTKETASDPFPPPE